MSDAAAQAVQELSVLSKRQRECLVLVAKGMTTKQIGECLSCSFKTIEVHLHKMREKLEMTTIEAVVLAVKANWV